MGFPVWVAVVSDTGITMDVLYLCYDIPELGRLVCSAPSLTLLIDVVTPSRQLLEEFCEVYGWVDSGKFSDQHFKKPVYFPQSA